MGVGLRGPRPCGTQSPAGVRVGPSLFSLVMVVDNALRERWTVKILLANFCLTLLVEPALMGRTSQGEGVSGLLEELSNELR